MSLPRLPCQNCLFGLVIRSLFPFQQTNGKMNIDQHRLRNRSRSEIPSNKMAANVTQLRELAELAPGRLNRISQFKSNTNKV